MSERLASDRRATLEQIFSHPAGANIEWRVTLTLPLCSSVTENTASRSERPTREKDVDKETIVELRRMLSSAGLSP
jgi:hypothetical protein